jgi:hypothetical protein
MTREVPNITRICIRIDTLEIPVDKVVEDLPKPKGSEKKLNVDYRANNHATTAAQIYDDGLIPEEDWELLTDGKYGRRIEIDNAMAYVGAERFWLITLLFESNATFLPDLGYSRVVVDLRLIQ